MPICARLGKLPGSTPHSSPIRRSCRVCDSAHGWAATATATPLVTPAVTRETLAELRGQALALQRNLLMEARSKLSLSSLLRPAPASLERKIEALGALVGAAALEEVRTRNPNEPGGKRSPSFSFAFPPADEAAVARGSPQRALLSLRLPIHPRPAGGARLSSAKSTPSPSPKPTSIPLLRAAGGFWVSPRRPRHPPKQRPARDRHRPNFAHRRAGRKPTSPSWDEARRVAFLNEQLESAQPLLNVAELTDREPWLVRGCPARVHAPARALRGRGASARSF